VPDQGGEAPVFDRGQVDVLALDLHLPLDLVHAECPDREGGLPGFPGGRVAQGDPQAREQLPPPT
jgi:hypothetical protein